MIKKENSRVNVKARLDRHLRIIKENIWVNNEKVRVKNDFQFNAILFVLLLIIPPVYPTLAWFMYDSSRYDFYRWDIDESSIIDSYYWWDQELDIENSPILESMDSFISVNTILDDKRDLAWTNEIVNYEVKYWDSFSSIAYNFKVSTNSIYWANDFTKNHVLHPWEIIKVPPVTWLIHQVQSWDTISSIAKKYNIEESKIREQNKIDSGWWLIAWEVIVLPWAIKIIPKPVYVPPKVKTPIKKPTGWYSFANNSSSQIVTQKWQYKLTRRKPLHNFVWWNCTWYVAQYKSVNWWGNANQWLKNARAKWHATWSSPRIWSIVQLTGRWYNPKYGHVWIVMDIVWNDILVSDMNYRRLNEVTYRKISISDRSIDWYIYVD